MQTVFPSCSVLGTAVVPIRVIEAEWRSYILIQSYNTNPWGFISFSTRLTEAESNFLQFKTLPGSLLGAPLLSAGHSCLVQVVSDPISSHI